MAGFDVQIDSVSGINADTTNSIRPPAGTSGFGEADPGPCVPMWLVAISITAITGTWDFRLRYGPLGSASDVANILGQTTTGVKFMSIPAGFPTNAPLPCGTIGSASRLEMFYHPAAAGSLTATVRVIGSF